MKKYRLVVTTITDYDETEIPRIHQSLAKSFSPQFSQDLMDKFEAQASAPNYIASANVFKIEEIPLQ